MKKSPLRASKTAARAPATKTPAKMVLANVAYNASEKKTGQNIFLGELSSAQDADAKK